MDERLPFEEIAIPEFSHGYIRSQRVIGKRRSMNLGSGDSTIAIRSGAAGSQPQAKGLRARRVKE
jgi:hypothetical protein